MATTSSLDQRLAELRAHGRAPAWPGRNLGTLALEAAPAAPDRVLVIDANRRVTRAEMLDLALRLGGALSARGLGRGETLAFQLPNWWEACVVNLAAALFGWRLVPLLTIFRTAELAAILPLCGARAIFLPESYRGTEHPALLRGLAAPPEMVFTVRAASPDADSFEALVSGAPGHPDPAPVDDAKLVLFTSGSTGRPKGVIHSHASIDALIAAATDFWQVGADDVFYVPSPIGHIGGSIYAFEFPWITGCTAILAERWNGAAALAEMAANGVTMMAGATPFLADLVAAAEMTGERLPRLRRFICGGASVPPELVRKGLDRFPGAVVSRAYGSTEVPIVCPGARTRAEAEARTATDGEIAADLRITDPEGRPVAPGASGEIAVRTPRMMLGYLDPADEAEAFDADGYFRMGDLGRLVDGRFLEITGRTKDIIIRKGENISPLEIENALARHPAVRQAAVVGLPDPERGEMVAAFIRLAEGASFDLAEMTRHLTQVGLARQKLPERLELVSELPMNAIGKVQKPVLRALAVERQRGSG